MSKRIPFMTIMKVLVLVSNSYCTTFLCSRIPTVKSFSFASSFCRRLSLRVVPKYKTSATTNKCFYTSRHSRSNTNHAIRRSALMMMPEGPEVRTLVDQLQQGVGTRLLDIQFLSGRYVTHGKPNGFHDFAKTMTQISLPASTSKEEELNVDIIREWNCKGKFIYIILDDGNDIISSNNVMTTTNMTQEEKEETSGTNHNDENHNTNSNIGNNDFQRSIWITLGMTGRFISESAHHQNINSKDGNSGKYARWYLHVLDMNTNKQFKIYYYDNRNFGTLKFCLSYKELHQKLNKLLGPDILSTNEETFLNVIFSSKTNQKMNICKFLMNQSKISGIGNYLLSEGLYKANIDPFASINEIINKSDDDEDYDDNCDEEKLKLLFSKLQETAISSYQSQGLTRKDGGTYSTMDGTKGNFEFQLVCYGKQVDPYGNPVIKEVNGPHGRTIWYTEKQLLMPLRVRYNNGDVATPTADRSLTDNDDMDADDDCNYDYEFIEMNNNDRNNKNSNYNIHLVDHITDPEWKEVLSDVTKSDSFVKLNDFVLKEYKSHTIYPPIENIFSALNSCPFNKVKVVIVGQDPYHGPNQGHGLAFSVNKNFKPLPPSLKNIFYELMSDNDITSNTRSDNKSKKTFQHGNLLSWSHQGVLLLNTVLTVRHKEPNSHSKKYGWEEFTDTIIKKLNEEHEGGLVFLLWGAPAQKKLNMIDQSKHHAICTSHPSPLGARKTNSPFIGSKCFSRTNKILKEIGKEEIDWNIY